MCWPGDPVFIRISDPDAEDPDQARVTAYIVERLPGSAIPVPRVRLGDPELLDAAQALFREAAGESIEIRHLVLHPALKRPLDLGPAELAPHQRVVDSEFTADGQLLPTPLEAALPGILASAYLFLAEKKARKFMTQPGYWRDALGSPGSVPPASEGASNVSAISSHDEGDSVGHVGEHAPPEGDAGTQPRRAAR